MLGSSSGFGLLGILSEKTVYHRSVENESGYNLFPPLRSLVSTALSIFVCECRHGKPFQKTHRRTHLPLIRRKEKAPLEPLAKRGHPSPWKGPSQKRLGI